MEIFGKETWELVAWEKAGVKVDLVTYKFWIRYLWNSLNFVLLRSSLFTLRQGWTKFQNIWESCQKFVGDWRVTTGKFHTGDPQILGRHHRELCLHEDRTPEICTAVRYGYRSVSSVVICTSWMKRPVVSMYIYLFKVNFIMYSK
jgi:hypothetical protein